MQIRFEWDDAKAASNLTKHKVSFETATLAFTDPFALIEQNRIEGGEVRWQTVGMVGGQMLLLVAHTILEDGDEHELPLDIIRIISARKATRQERQRYEQQNN